MKELTDFEVNKLLDTLNLLEATCLIVGVSPDEIRDVSDNQNEYELHNRYYLNNYQNSSSKHFPLVLNSLIRGIEFKKIESSKVVYYPLIDRQDQIIDPKQTCIEKLVLIDWLKKKGVYPDALFPLEPDNEILNRTHPFYSPKLALIVEAWQQLKYAELNNQTVKKYIEDWIRDNAIKYEFNNMGETSISNLAEIVNFEKGGMRVTGSLMDKFDTIEKKNERLQKKQESYKEFTPKEDLGDLPF